jgi:NAD-dependent dihydropyrimidine dehydrogenase PreA subunit
MLTIDVDKCIQCGLCGLLCPASAIVNGEIDNELCIECSECQRNCPETAIK